MAFEKMTVQELEEKFVRIFPQYSAVKRNVSKIGARMLRIELEWLERTDVLYFLWYDEMNWNLGTKPYRKQPIKQMYKKLKNQNTFGELKEQVSSLPPETDLAKMDIELGKKFTDTFKECVMLASNPDMGAFTKAYLASLGGINSQDIDPVALGKTIREIGGTDSSMLKEAMLNRAAEEMANEPLKPIDWVKEDPEVIMASYPPSAE